MLFVKQQLKGKFVLIKMIKITNIDNKKYIFIFFVIFSSF